MLNARLLWERLTGVPGKIAAWGCAEGVGVAFLVGYCRLPGILAFVPLHIVLQYVFAFIFVEFFVEVLGVAVVGIEFFL